MQERLDAALGDVFFAGALEEVPLCVDEAGGGGPGAEGETADEPGAGGLAQTCSAAGGCVRRDKTTDGAIP